MLAGTDHTIEGGGAQLGIEQVIITAIGQDIMPEEEVHTGMFTEHSKEEITFITKMRTGNGMLKDLFNVIERVQIFLHGIKTMYMQIEMVMFTEKQIRVGKREIKMAGQKTIREINKIDQITLIEIKPGINLHL